MNNQLLKQAVEITENGGYIIIATTDKNGTPHIATAGKLECDDIKDVIKVTEWFCSKTVANLRIKKQISVAVWNPEMDKGYQLQGNLIEVRDKAVLDGYTKEELQEQIPQAKRELLIKVELITEFSQAIHSDENLLKLQDEVKI